MTLVEVLVVVFVLAALITFLLPALSPPHHTSPRIYCVNNLKQIGLAFRIWEGDNADKFPMQVGAKEGGAMELAITGNVARIFQVMSNELVTPKLLVCPADKGHRVAANWSDDFGNKNISYFVGLDAANQFTNSILAGDGNFEIQGTPVKSGVLELSTNSAIAWTGERHRFSGNIGLADGSVNTMLNSGLTNAIIRQYEDLSGFTNRFRIAIP